MSKPSQLETSSPQIKSAVYLDSPATVAEQEEAIRAPLDATDLVIQVQPEDLHQITKEDTQEPKKSLWKRPLAWLFAGVIGLSIGQFVMSSIAAIQDGNWLATGWLALLVAVAALAANQGIEQWRSLRKLKRQMDFKHQGEQLLNANTIGQAEDFCARIGDTLQGQYQTQIIQWQGQVEPHHLDAEVIQLFEQHVLVVADKQALNCVTKNASACAAMIAVSPFALLDMAIVLWRNLLMLNQISRVYGLNLSYWGRIKLIRQVFKHMLYAGAAEIISDAGNYALGAGVTGKLSTRLAQGLGAGVLTSRVGLKAIQSCRPLPFVKQKPPGIGDLTQQLLKDLKKQLSE